jgi:hypothetical protein
MATNGMTIYLCDTHTMADVVTNWGGCEPHIEKPSSAKTRGATCDACASLATKTTRMVFTPPTNH